MALNLPRVSLPELQRYMEAVRFVTLVEETIVGYY